MRQFYEAYQCDPIVSPLVRLESPDAGEIIKGSGGVRKVRWASTGSGKRGGLRVIYYWKNASHEIWMLTLYSKSEQSTIPGHMLKQIAEAIRNE
ncbi:MAG: type II toxin-antitoxin system RelE/ParE family toxin [Gammaproteobacteria bacterium]|nr:type II toxin-antitoxin system RelE/ParE family toxin [Gammaproteobacteria bacterium]